MGFDAEMSRFCGRTARVKARATRCVDERTGRMLTMKNPCIILEDIVCEGAFTANCPREYVCWWREIWLEDGSQPGHRHDQAVGGPDWSRSRSRSTTAPRHIAQVVESVLAQTHTDLELVISDNASTDGTQEICRQFAQPRPTGRLSAAPDATSDCSTTSSARRRRQLGRTCAGSATTTRSSRTSSRSVLDVFADDPRRVLVTTQIVYRDSEGVETLETDYDPADHVLPPTRWNALRDCCGCSRLTPRSSIRSTE